MYNCIFHPPAKGKYVVHAKWNGDDIRGSPFRLKVLAPPNPNGIKAYGPGLADGNVGKKGTFTIETTEGGSGALRVRVHGHKKSFKVNFQLQRF